MSKNTNINTLNKEENVRPGFDKKDREAVKRMRLLGISDEIIRKYAEYGDVYRSEAPYGKLYPIEGEGIEKLKTLEEKYGIRAYLIIHSHTNYGTMDSYLFVSKYENEWESERELFKYGRALVYAYNLDYPYLSEMGVIGIEPTTRGIVRTW